MKFLNKLIVLIRRFYHSKIFLVIITFLFTPLINSALEKSSEFLATKYLSKKKMCYEIINKSKYGKNELLELSSKLGVEKFDLNLDDPILRDYYLIQVKLKNQGASLHGPIKFILSCGNDYSKIIDLKYKVKKPSNKVIQIIHTLPPLNWEIGEDIFPTVSWDFDTLEGCAGVNFYGSLNKEVGFGKINERLITNMEYKIPINPMQDLSKIYFRITAESVDGEETDMSEEHICTPDVFAFTPFFKDVYWVDPKSKSNDKSDGSKAKPFKSLKEAIANTNNLETFIVDQYRKEIVDSSNISKEVKVFYKDELTFLNGKIEFSVLDGIDEDAEIELFILCKILDFKKFNAILKLNGSPEVDFENKNKSSIDTTNFEQPNNENQKNLKLILTPKIVKTYLGFNKIFLAWEIPENSQYKGVRIFRSEKRTLSDFENLGKEIYDGIGSVAETLHCEYDKQKSIDQNFDEFIYRPLKRYEPPPKFKKPPSPLNLKMIYVNTFEVKSPFFEDKTVTQGYVYTYTLYTYDINGNYSYPILINASLDDWSPKHNCMRLVR